MSTKTDTFIALDVGTKRIGVARADSGTKLAFPVGTVEVDGLEIERLQQIISEVEPVKIIVGYPRNQSGGATDQTHFVEQFTKQLYQFELPIIFQDESLTSVVAKERLEIRQKQYKKGDIDSEAATIILQDYIERCYGR